MTMVLARTLGAITVLVVAISVGWLSFVNCYRLELAEPTLLYAKWENVPFDRMEVIRSIDRGESVDVVRCVDVGSDVYFEVETLLGQRGVMYTTKFIATKEPFWENLSGLVSAFAHPLDALACVALLPRFSEAASRRIERKR